MKSSPIFLCTFEDLSLSIFCGDDLSLFLFSEEEEEEDNDESSERSRKYNVSFGLPLIFLGVDNLIFFLVF